MKQATLVVAGAAIALGAAVWYGYLKTKVPTLALQLPDFTPPRLPVDDLANAYPQVPNVLGTLYHIEYGQRS